MISWDDLETVLLDMDGTLLDLHFDDYFWQELIPQKWGEKNGMDATTAKSKLIPIFQQTEASLAWYCLDFWSDKLDLDVFEIGAELEHLIELRPHAEEFLLHLAEIGKKVVLVTNSHEKFISLKMKNTKLERHFHHIFNAHSFGRPKEEVEFWQILGNHIDYMEQSTVLIDDNLAVLRSARRHGIRHLLGIAQPNTRAPVRDTAEFRAVSSFRDLCH